MEPVSFCQVARNERSFVFRALVIRLLIAIKRAVVRLFNTALSSDGIHRLVYINRLPGTRQRIDEWVAGDAKWTVEGRTVAGT